MSRGVGLLGSPAFTQKAVFKAQTERKVSQWENKLKENTGTQVWEVCLSSPARRAPRNGAGGWQSVNRPPPPLRPGSRAMLLRGPQLRSGPDHCFSECGPRMGASPQAACPQPMMR